MQNPQHLPATAPPHPSFGHMICSEEENKLRSTLQPSQQEERPQPQQQRNTRRRRQQQPVLDHALPPRSDRRPANEKTLSRHSTRYSLHSTDPADGKADGSANGSFRGSRVARSQEEEKRGGVSEDAVLFDFARGAREGDVADSLGVGDMGGHAGRAAMATDEFGMRLGGRLSQQQVGVVETP